MYLFVLWYSGRRSSNRRGRKTRWLKVLSDKSGQKRNRNSGFHTLNLPSNNIFSLHTIPPCYNVYSRHRHKATTLLSVSHGAAHAEKKAANACSLPSPSVVPSLHPSVTSFLLSPSVSPPLLLSPVSPLIPTLTPPIWTACISCVVYRHVRVLLNYVFRTWLDSSARVSRVKGKGFFLIRLCLH